jgi:hypothetical protein
VNAARLTRSAARWAIFATGAAVGAAIATRRPYGTDYWRRQAVTLAGQVSGLQDALTYERAELATVSPPLLVGDIWPVAPSKVTYATRPVQSW